MTASGPAYSPDEMMAVTAARRLRNGTVCFVGIGLPSRAANLARRTHAPGCVLIYESGTIGARPEHLPLSIGDGELAETADAVVSVPEIFSYWLQGGRVDVGFLGAAQIDRYGNLNSTVIGDYDQPQVRLPGAGGAPEIAASCKETFVMLRQTPRAFVEQLDFRSSVGYGDGPDTRARLGFSGAGVTAVVTDLGVLEPDPETKELTLTLAHPGVAADEARAATGWELLVAEPARDDRAAERGGAGGPARAQDRDGGEWLRWRPSRRLCRRSPTRSGRRTSIRRTTTPTTWARGSGTRRSPSPSSRTRLTELTGPVFGDGPLGELDNDLTRQHAGEPLGERIIVAGRLLGSDGKPLRGQLVEIWQANAAGRYQHEVDAHPAPARPELLRRRSDAHGRRRPVPVRHDQARRVPVAEPPERLAAPRTSTSRSSGARSPTGSSPRCTSRATRSSRSTRSSTRSATSGASERMISAFDLELTEPELGARLPLRHRPRRPRGDAVRGAATDVPTPHAVADRRAVSPDRAALGGLISPSSCRGTTRARSGSRAAATTAPATRCPTR